MPESKRRKPKAGGPTPAKNPIIAAKEPSPTWYVAVMATLMGAGVLAVLVRFVFNTSHWVLLVGLALIAVGFIMTTNYR